MAGTGRLERIAALTDLLVAVAGRQRGEPIEAEQWNTIVDVLRGILEIDRAQETGLAQNLADAFSPADHEHLGQVTLAWLDADLQDRMVTGGAGGAISVRGALTGMTARVGDLSGVVSSLSTQLETIQQRTDDSKVDELGRSSKLRAFETRFNGLEDLRGLVTSVAAQVQDLEPNVQAVLDLRTQLTTPEGLPIDVSALNNEVAGLDAALSAATSGVDGATLRMRDLQLAIQELQAIGGVGGGGGLDQLLATLGAQLQGNLDTRLDERLAAQQADVAAIIDQRFAALEQQFVEIEQKIDSRLAEVVDEVTQRVFDQLVDRITETVLSRVQDQVASIVDDRIGARLDELHGNVKELAERVRRLENRVFG